MGWQLTAITIYCDAVDDEVTIIVHKAGATTCTGYNKYSEPSKEAAKLMQGKSKQLKRQLKCEGLDCYRVVQQKNKLIAEEAKTGRSE